MLMDVAVPLIFYVCYQTLGVKPAIAIAMAAVLAQFVARKIWSLRVSPVAWTAASLTLAFGAIDLAITSPRFFRFEPALKALIAGLAFAGTLGLERPAAAWYLDLYPAPFRPIPGEADSKYVRDVTVATVIYHVIKAALLFYLAFVVNLGQLMALKVVISATSLAAFLGGEFLYRRYLRPRSLAC